MEESILIKESREYAESVLGTLPEGYCYHNLDHTREVVSAASEIGSSSDLEDEDMELIILAAWYHDLGYSSGFLVDNRL